MRKGEIFKKENILVGASVSDWKEAVRAAGGVLEAAGSATSRYTEEMVAAVEEMGPYMVILPKLALAHAAPSGAVLRNDVSLVTLKEPVRFGSENDPVHVVLCICCTDRESHREALQRIARMVMDEDIVDRLAAAASVEEILSVAEGY